MALPSRGGCPEGSGRVAETIAGEYAAPGEDVRVQSLDPAGFKEIVSRVPVQIASRDPGDFDDPSSVTPDQLGLADELGLAARPRLP